MKDAFVQVKFGNEVLNVRVHPETRRRFKAICDAEKVSMSDKIREWLIIYTHEHERGNPQKLLSPRNEKNLLEQLLDEEQLKPAEFPFNRMRREIMIKLAKFINANPEIGRSEAIQRFALQNGFTVDRIREYVGLMDSQAKRRRANGRANPSQED